MDKDQIKIKLKVLIVNLENLNLAYKKYLQIKDDLDKLFMKNAIAKFVEEIVEGAISINNILLKEKEDFPSTYYESFSKLTKHYKLDEKFILNIAKTTSFRNNVVHNYADIRTQLSLEKNIEPFIVLYKNYIKLIRNLIKN